ncbi:MAG: 2-hydroxy-6-oxononadienedioate/2-hydroxy-6-oxononatrienedioate hydrolase [Chlamydiales bacterium]|nr:2-hydroxy-6-oxononadienedioate/2-hydroxy-6-oxononatrienedioate hydrolase [Chlamydiales bacterium]MCH9634879.1 2-hydroxy-6-oxononadienedioate/2-hydroxy-6-oxononatrienedioate hydrolase [Chlamydiales bacterium]MCH9703708.1 alpha/beta hydrolase [Chlamydiota bacterium]
MKEVEYELTGEGPTILVSHGGMGGVDQAKLLTEWVDKSRFSVLSISRPGYMGTPIESGKSIEEQADLFAELLDHLKIEQVALFSASAGGPPAYSFAIRHPDRTKALIAVDSVSGYYDMPPGAGPVTEFIFMSRPGQAILNKMQKMAPKLFLKQLLQQESTLTDSKLAERIEYISESEEALHFVNCFMATMNDYHRRKVGTENDIAQTRRLTHLQVEQIDSPSLIIHGTHDGDVNFYDAVYAYEHIPNAEKFWIEDGSHFAFWLSPQAKEAQARANQFLEKNLVAA